MRTFLAAYARAVGALGLALLVAALVVDRAWLTEAIPIAVMIGTVIALRLQQIPLTKYGALNMLALPALAGALIVGAPATALAMWVGVAIADGVVVGSAIVRAAGESVSQAVALTSSLRAAIDAA